MKLTTGLLENKAYIVTGAGGGIGREACRVLAEAGAHVIATDIVADSGEATVAAIRGAGLRAEFFQADLGSEDDVQALVDFAVRSHGRLDGAFNNAGLEQCALPLHELTLDQWNRALRIDLTSVFLCVKYQVIAMLKTGGGAIVNTASSLGQVAIANASEYITAKHGVVGLTRAAAAEYGCQGHSRQRGSAGHCAHAHDFPPRGRSRVLSLFRQGEGTASSGPLRTTQ
jgi:NAD(P)-dependent dehydrogenase (short-subunit alcohol dehydrogenase family)